MKAFIVSLLAASLLPAQIPGSFRNIDIDCGGWFTGLVQHSSGRLYGRTDVGGIYRSDDRGDSWTFLSGDFANPGGLFVQGIAVAKKNPDVIYQACGVSYFPNDPDRGIWKSSDAGQNWRQVKAEINFSGNDDARHGGECLAIHPDDDSEVWAGSRGNGLWRSTDAGQSWNQVGGPTFDTLIITGITFHPKFPDQVWVSTESGLWISWDRGQNWKQELPPFIIFRTVRRPDGSGFAVGGKYHPTKASDTKLWHLTKDDWSTEGSPTFTDRWPNYVAAFNKAKGYEPVDQAAALALLRDGSLVTAGFFRLPARSSDHGESFEVLPTTVAGELPAWALADRNNNQGGWNQIFQDVTNDKQWFTTGGYGPTRSDDAGQTWKYITKGIGEVVTWRTQFHPTNPDIVIIPAADHGLTTIQDGGRSGKTVGTISRLFPWPEDVLTFAHSAAAHEHRIIALGGAPIKGEARVWHSLDQGTTWKKIPAKGYPQKHGFEWVEMAANMQNPDEILALMGGPIGPAGGGIYRSLDAGLSFTQAQLPAELNGIDAGSQFVWNTRLYADGRDPSRYYLSIRDLGIYRSTDQGLTWEKVRQEGLPSTHGHLGTEHQTKHRLWFASNIGLHQSDDGGETWLKIEGFESTSDVNAVAGHIAVIGKKIGDDFQKIYYSDDDGKTWREITRKGYRFGNMLAVAVDPHHPGQVWISTNGRSTAVFTPSKQD